MDKLIHAAIDPFDRKDVADIVAMAAYTGMRQGELLKIKARDIDLGAGLIHVGGRPDQRTKPWQLPCHSCPRTYIWAAL